MKLDEITVHFAHPAYQLQRALETRETPIRCFQSWSREEMATRIGESEVLVATGFWQNSLIPDAHRLRFIQACGAGFDQFDATALDARGIRLANASGVNVNAVSDHAIALLLGLTRQLHIARDNQHKRNWRGMISDLGKREDELPGKTLLILGLGKIGARLAHLANAFGMRVIGIKRDTSQPAPAGTELFPPEALEQQLPRADFVALTCPLTEQTRNVINARTLALMKPTAYLINVARGGCVDEPALIAALHNGEIAGAGIDVTASEPLQDDSPLWAFQNVILTPHTGGETTRYEENVIDILLENLARLERGERELHNQVV